MVAASLWATIAKVIIQGNFTRSGSVSWFRAYHVGLLLPDVPSFIMSGEAGERLTAVEHTQQRFFDIQTRRSRHATRALYTPSVHATGLFRQNGRMAEFGAPVNIHLLAHASGFVCLRPTIRFDQVQPAADGWLLRHLERGLWDTDLDLRFSIAGTAEPVTGNVRPLLNWVFLDLLTRWSGSRPDPEQLTTWSAEQDFGCERLHQLVAEGRLDYAYPVSFGTQLELTDSRLAARARNWDEVAAQISHQIMRGPSPDLDVSPVDVERDCRNLWWYVEESKALTLTPPRCLHPELNVVDPDRTQLLEFLTIRRAALRSVQRDTQRMLADGSRISRARVDGWHQIVTTTTDDYVLDDRIGQLISLLRQHNSNDRRLRDLAELEEQVRANLDSFQRRLEAGGAWVSSVLGALVGAGALVIGLDSVTRSILSRVVGVSVTDLPVRYGGLLSAVTITLLALTFAGTYTLIRRASESLQTRLQARRRPLGKAMKRLRPPQRAGTRYLARRPCGPTPCADIASPPAGRKAP